MIKCEEEVRQCKTCGLFKPIQTFHKSKKYKDGRMPECWDCRRKKVKPRHEYRKAWYWKNRDKCIEDSKKYYETHKIVCSERDRKYHQENKDKIREKSHQAYLKNIEYYRQYNANYRKKNHEKLKIQKREWQKNSMASILHRGALRRAQKIHATPQWADKVKIKQIYKEMRQHNILYPEKAPWSVDHIVPLQGKIVSGFHVEYNLRIIPLAENVSKKNKLIANLVA